MGIYPFTYRLMPHNIPQKLTSLFVVLFPAHHSELTIRHCLVSISQSVVLIVTT